MRDNDTYYEKIKERLQEQPRNRFHQGGKRGHNNIIKTTKRDYIPKYEMGVNREYRKN